MPSPWTLHRSADDAKLGGVCGGVADRWGIDPVLVRVGFVLLALSGGVGVVLYLAGWLLLPVAGTDRAAVDDLFGGAAARWPRELWTTLVVVACVVSFAVLSAVTPFGVVPALAVLGLWWLGRRRHARATDRPGPDHPYAVGATPPPVWQGPETPFSRAASAWQARVTEVRSGVWSGPAPQPGVRPDGTAPQDTRWDPVPTAPPVPLPTEPGHLAEETAAAVREEAARAAFLSVPDPVGLYTEPAVTPVPAARPGAALAARRVRLASVTALGLTWLGLGVADALGVRVDLAVYAGAGLLVLALGLLAAARWGRARGLLAGAVVLALAAATTSSLTSGLVGPAVAGPARAAGLQMSHPVAYTTAAALPAAGDVLDVGSLDVDLTGLDLTADATYRATVDTGRLVVRTPPGTGVDLRYDVDAGHITSYGSPFAAGTDLKGDRLLVAPAAGQHTITLDLRVDTGVLEVRS